MWLHHHSRFIHLAVVLLLTLVGAAAHTVSSQCQTTRDGKSFSVVVPPGAWVITARPHLAEGIARLYARKSC